jgi:hypothetical protein
MTLARASCVLALLLQGCDDPTAVRDNELKATLIGHWLREADSELNGMMIRERISHSPDGKFVVERIKIDSTGAATREEESGSWFVTAGLYKMRTEFVGRKQLNTAEQLYSTCTIQKLSTEELVCVNYVDKWTKNQRRIADDFRL